MAASRAVIYSKMAPEGKEGRVSNEDIAVSSRELCSLFGQRWLRVKLPLSSFIRDALSLV